ncbi:hypothetical protein BO94DRAFT_540006 [Aspergillus sclerotioniger CBS 115572]|uniref:Uncharacterized protein n=1 Tax=Aspergillus sclerotioniger CBS 115572 TaxID=1450535 RepID=A0A317V571_9EURO|nr:hypothetical protein BO94DRAFT_540006 [Aspergillus sclerotioniger CBS 115572]PWY69156.1 hypothetical protein BO94DRAFT_540006 [Aspergillus sclerotioniger CBS 115572]
MISAVVGWIRDELDIQTQLGVSACKSMEKRGRSELLKANTNSILVRLHDGAALPHDQLLTIKLRPQLDF